MINLPKSNIRQTPEYAEFSAGQAAEISGVNAPLQRNWRQRGLLPDVVPGKHARFGPGEVLDMMIMKAFSDSNISIKGARIFLQTAGQVARAFLNALPGAVEIIVADSSLGPGIIDEERRSIEEWRDTHLPRRYLYMPLPEREDGSDSIAIHECENLSDLHTLLNEDTFHGLLIDTDAIARAFLARARNVTDRPLMTVTFTREADTPWNS